MLAGACAYMHTYTRVEEAHAPVEHVRGAGIQLCTNDIVTDKHDSSHSGVGQCLQQAHCGAAPNHCSLPRGLADPGHAWVR